MRSSFGPGVFSNFDCSLNLAPGLIEFHDPKKDQSIDLTDPNSDGLFTDETFRTIKQLRMLDSGGVQTSVMANARTAELTTHDGFLYTFEVFRSEPSGTVNFHGRLKSIKDRNGVGYTLTYVNTDPQVTDAALNGDRQGLWRYASVTDAYGKQISFTWARSNGQWSISQAALPNGQNIGYTYSAGSLSSLNGISYPDGSVSTFDTQYNAATGFQKLTFDDAGAEDTHRRKSVYLTTSQYLHSTSDGNLVMPQPSNLVRQVENGAGELAYKNWITWSGSTCNIYYYEGGGADQNGGRLYWLDTDDGIPRKKYVAKTFNLASAISSYTWELMEEYTLDAQRRITTKKNPLGRVDYTLDPATGAVLEEKSYKADNSLYATETTTYNSFKQPLLSTDRLGRIAKYEYDINGNMLKKYAAFGTADQSLWEWTFNIKGQPLTSKDANLNVTDYVYNAAGFLTTITEPADITGGARAVRTFTYDAAGRLDTATEPAGDTTTRTVTYGYDTRSRLASITYHDSSSDIFVYGNGSGASGNANLLIQQVDRNGRNTVFEYDLAGRKTRSYVVGTGNPPIEDEKTFVYLSGSNVVSQSTDRGNTTTRTFDYLRRPKTVVVTPNTTRTLTTTMTYDAYGRLILEADPWNRRTFYGYDFEDRLIRTVRETVPGGIWATTDPFAMVRAFDYNALLAIEDTEYDVEGQVLKRIDARGIVDTFTYDFQGRLKSTTKAAAKRDAAGAETAITNMKIAAKTEYTYDAQGNTLSVKHPRSFDPAEGADFITQSAYTNRNLLKTRTEAFGRTEAATQSFTYTLERKLADVTDGRGNIWSQIWKQCCGRLAAKVDPLLTDSTRPLTFYNYDAVGNQTHTAVLRDISGLPSCCNPDPLDADTYSEITTRYDVLNRPIAQTRWLAALGQVNENNPPIAGLDGVPAANGMTTRWTYDDNLTDGLGLDVTYAAKLTGLNLGAGCVGSAVEITSPTGEKSLSIMDGLGRAVRTVDPAGNATTTAYDVLYTKPYNVNLNGQLVSTIVTDPTNATFQSFADALGRVAFTTDAMGYGSVHRFDIGGNLTYTRDVFSRGMDYVYDERNRQTEAADTLATPSVTKKEYDAHGNVIKDIDARNKNTVYVYDARDRKKTVTDRISAVTQFQYDGNNNLTQITDAQTGVTTYAYDARNLLSDETFPGHSLPSNNEKRLYTYDPAKRLKTRTDQTSTVSTYVYDLAGRLTTRSYPDSLNDSFTYDLSGRVLTANSLRYSNLVTRTYDTFGRLGTETQRVGAVDYVVGYGYDALNRPANVTYPNGKIVNRTWTPHRQADLINYDGVMERDYTYYWNLKWYYYNGNGRSLTFTFNNDYTLASKSGLLAGGVESYTYDANKQKTGVTTTTIPSNDRTFTYDDEGRLTGFTRNNGDAQSWNLSLVGDWNTFTKNGTPETRTHNSVHEVTQVAATPLTYDLRGNLLTNNNGQTYTWDIENRLKTATGTGLNASYAYDALGRRVSKTVNGFTTVFISDGLREICEYDNGAAPASPTRLYVFDEYIDEPILMIAGGVKYYYGTDTQYSVMGINNAAGTFVEKYKYDPYGKVTILAADGVTVRATSSIGNEITYTGRRRDAETGLYYFRSRYYSGDLGRFVSRDALTYVSGMSMYRGYFAPLSVDPFGYDPPVAGGGTVGYNPPAPPAPPLVITAEDVLVGTGQGALNIGNGVTDIPHSVANDILKYPPMGPPRPAMDAFWNIVGEAPQIPYPDWMDWSKDKLVQNDEFHDTSKFVGGNSAFFLFSWFLPKVLPAKQCTPCPNQGPPSTPTPTPPVAALTAWQLRAQWIRARLMEHLQQAMAQARLTRPQVADIMKNGNGSRHWGTQIDTRFKELVQNDMLLKGDVVVSPRKLPKGCVAPDIVDVRAKNWWDATSDLEEFLKKPGKYNPQYGGSAGGGEGGDLLYGGKR